MSRLGKVAAVLVVAALYLSNGMAMIDVIHREMTYYSIEHRVGNKNVVGAVLVALAGDNVARLIDLTTAALTLTAVVNAVSWGIDRLRR